MVLDRKSTIKICPKCKTSSMELYMGAIFGKYRCKKCGYIGNLVIEKDLKIKKGMKRITLLILVILLIGGCNQKMPVKNKRVLMVIAPEDFKDDEYYVPKEIFESMGIQVITTSSAKESSGVSGRKQVADILLNKATTNYDAVIFIGGPGASFYFENNDAMNLARNFYNQNKIVAAICIAPSILANAGILRGKRATAFPSEEQNMLNNGVNYTAELVTVDGNIITGKNPGAAREFSSRIIKALEGK